MRYHQNDLEQDQNDGRLYVQNAGFFDCCQSLVLLMDVKFFRNGNNKFHQDCSNWVSPEQRGIANFAIAQHSACSSSKIPHGCSTDMLISESLRSFTRAYARQTKLLMKIGMSCRSWNHCSVSRKPMLYEQNTYEISHI